MTRALQEFEAHRPALLALAYRMLADLGRAEDVVQEAWLRWQRHHEEALASKPYLLTVVTHLCLNELASARARSEEARADRLPEPIDLARSGLETLESLEQISMAFLVMLQRLTPAERAVVLLHDVFDFSHAEIASMVEKSEAACRQLLRRARDHLAEERRLATASREEHRRLLQAFLRAARDGDSQALIGLIADDAILIADAGAAGGRFGRARNLPGPLEGATRIAAFVAAVTPQGSTELEARICELNGQPAIVALRDGAPYTAILLSVAGGKIRRVFICADAARLGNVV